MLNVINKAMKYNQMLNMIYMDNSGGITKRRIKVFKVSDKSFVAYCYLRGSKRTFKIDNVLALVPIITKERMVV